MNRRRMAMLVAALGGAGVWLLISRAPEPGAEPPDPVAETPVAAAVPRATETPAAPGRAAIPAQPGPPAEAAGTPPRTRKEERDPNRPFAIEGETAEDRAERIREHDELDRRWRGEPADGAWSNESGQRIAGLLAKGDLSPAMLREVDCRRSICRFELRSSSDTYGEVMSLVHAARELVIETWVHPQQRPDGTWRIEAFFPRDGYRLSGGGGRIDEATPRVEDAPDLHQPPAQKTTQEG